MKKKAQKGQPKPKPKTVIVDNANKPATLSTRPSVGCNKENVTLVECFEKRRPRDFQALTNRYVGYAIIPIEEYFELKQRFIESECAKLRAQLQEARSCLVAKIERDQKEKVETETTNSAGRLSGKSDVPATVKWEVSYSDTKTGKKVQTNKGTLFLGGKKEKK
jgi:hypothetical protein